MLISPPFLSTPQGNREADDVYTARNMTGGTPGNGAFPVSFEFKWHGGIHLDAPNDMVRAVADGTVKYLRQPRMDCRPDDPLEYYKGWTSDGVVVIEHKTEIGENVEVTFYSVYMHLSAIASGVKGGKPIYRKDEIGRAGYIYGEPNKLHFEICCDDANLEKLIGRKSGKLDITQDGRTNSIWGDMYFALPTGTVIYPTDMVAAQKAVNKTAAAAAKAQTNAADLVAKATMAQQDATAAATAAAAAPGNAALAQKRTATANAAKAAQKASTDAQTAATKAQTAATQAATDYTQHQQAAPNHSSAQPVSQPSPTYTTTQPLFVGMWYEHGNCTLTTYKESGNVVGTVAVGGYEYDLYKEATDLYPASPSAGYELLRFGRVIGPDAISPADAAHWRKISYPGGGEGWVDLRPDAIKKFSDADFPHWRGWTLIDDDTKIDSRCDSNALKVIVLDDGQSSLDISHAPQRLKAADVQAKLKYTICKIPSEWDVTDVDARWGWLKQDDPKDISPLLNQCMSDEAFDKLKAHIQALAFWGSAGMTPDPYWYFEPRKFIATFRKCGWLSLREMTQMLPAKSTAEGTISWKEAVLRLQSGYTKGNQQLMPSGLHLAIDKAFRKYCILNPLRQAHVFGQVFQETGALRLNIEGGNDRYFRTMYEVITAAEAGQDYDDKKSVAWRLGLVYKRVNNQKVLMTRAEYVAARPGQVDKKAKELGNTQPGDGPRFRGRGLIQLTGRNNYADYGRFRGHDYTTDPNPALLAADAFVSADISLKYWVSKDRHGLNINHLADAGADDAATEQVTRAVNGGTTHIEHRREYFNYAWGLLRDMPTPADTATLKRQKE